MIRNLEHAWGDEVEQMVKWFEEIACRCAEVCFEENRKTCEQEWRDLALKAIMFILSTKGRTGVKE